MKTTLQPLSAMLVIPPLPDAPVAPWVITKLAYDQARVQVSGVLTRNEVFRLIGELERIGVTL